MNENFKNVEAMDPSARQNANGSGDLACKPPMGLAIWPAPCTAMSVPCTAIRRASLHPQALELASLIGGSLRNPHIAIEAGGFNPQCTYRQQQERFAH